jgi:quercetin dioxygenase-like cupin family protein
MNVDQTDRTGDDVGVVRRADDVPFNDVAAGRDTSMQVLVGPGEGAPNFVLRRFRMLAGGGIPLHTNEVEHEQYVLRGRARIRIGDDVHDVKADDTLFIPAGVAHSYEVTDGPFEFLCVVPNAPDQIRLRDDAC